MIVYTVSLGVVAVVARRGSSTSRLVRVVAAVAVVVGVVVVVAVAVAVAVGVVVVVRSST